MPTNRLTEEAVVQGLWTLLQAVVALGLPQAQLEAGLGSMNLRIARLEHRPSMLTLDLQPLERSVSSP